MKEMGVIARDERQLTLIYSSNTRVGTHTLWAEIADALGVGIGDLVDKRQMDIEVESTAEFDSNDWLKIIQNNDSVISKPIAIKGNRTKQIDNPPEIMEFFEVDSAGLEQSPSNDTPPDIERTTGNENFIEKEK